MRKGPIGVMNLNNELQAVLNPPSKKKTEKKFREITFRQGDKVMQIKNNYTQTWQKIRSNEEGMGVFNGDIGFIQQIENEGQYMTIVFDDEKIVYYDFGQLDELELAYAITVHKSQGCEFPVVVMPIFSGPPMLLTRNLLYTGITRSKELVVLVGKEEYLEEMINNNNESKRYSGLCGKLKSTDNFVNYSIQIKK
jgi:exodeoxyribonuclease V alpha subunit